jgi:glyoxylase-like metal-dependent hydrolase (beta-lactamase superfamily II)
VCAPLLDLNVTLVDPPSYPAVDAVASGVLRLRVPVPFGRLGDVNAYLLHDTGGWTVVDTGLNTPAARAAWRSGLSIAGIDVADLQRIVLTHSHPDHFGLAGWLQDQIASAGGTAPVFLTRREQELARYWSTAASSDEPLKALLRRCGVPASMPDTVTGDLQRLRQATQPHPSDVRTLRLGASLRIGARCFAIQHTPGHSDGHAVLYDADDRLLLVGDHVLPHITPTISRWPSTAPDPLGRYLRSLRAMRRLDVRQALPGHGAVIDDWTARLQALLAHHTERLAFMEQAVGTEATVFDVAQQAFELERLNAGEVRFAIAETLAHLDYLVGTGRLHRCDEPVWQFEPATPQHTSASAA